MVIQGGKIFSGVTHRKLYEAELKLSLWGCSDRIFFQGMIKCPWHLRFFAIFKTSFNLLLLFGNVNSCMNLFLLQKVAHRIQIFSGTFYLSPHLIVPVLTHTQWPPRTPGTLNTQPSYIRTVLGFLIDGLTYLSSQHVMVGLESLTKSALGIMKWPASLSVSQIPASQKFYIRLIRTSTKLVE